jgi:hypothetical protein
VIQTPNACQEVLQSAHENKYFNRRTSLEIQYSYHSEIILLLSCKQGPLVEEMINNDESFPRV